MSLYFPGCGGGGAEIKKRSSLAPEAPRLTGVSRTISW